jgi:hypothetical protein
MDDKAELERLLTDGYLIHGPIINLSDHTPESIRKAHTFFKIGESLEVLLDQNNRRKSLIMLRQPSTNCRVEILTANAITLRRAEDQLRYQNKPIGSIVRAHVIAMGGRSTSRRIFHLDKLISSLDGLWGWKFKLGDSVGKLEVEITLNSSEDSLIEKTLSDLQYLLDCLAISLQVGFRIQHSWVGHIPRYGPYVSGVGSEERMLENVAIDEIERNIEVITTSQEYAHTARGLNEAYAENTAAGRLSRLWATVETVFTSKPEPLLTSGEVSHLLDCAGRIPSLVGDNERFGKLRQALSDADRLPSLTRNERISQGIASTMAITFDDAYESIKKASQLRGKHSHQISSDDLKEIEASEQFLQGVLCKYLTQHTK